MTIILGDTMFSSTVLIIDDLPENIEVLADYLTGDYHIKVASSGIDGLELLADGCQ